MRNARQHREGCVCPRRPVCLVHGAAEYGGGEPDTCEPHGHPEPEPITVDRLADAMVGLVFMDKASNVRIATKLIDRLSAGDKAEAPE